MKSISCLLIASVLVACGGVQTQNTVDNLRSSVPSRDTVALNVPGGSAQALRPEGQQQQALRGQTSEFYTATRYVTVMVNAATGLVLDLIQNIVRNPPTSFDGRVAVWGPYTDPLSRNTYRFTAQDNGNHSVSYALEGKGKNEPDSAYVLVLSGSGSPALDSRGNPINGYGSGTFTIDWTAASTLPDHDDNVGQGVFTYSRLSATSSTQIDVAFRQVKDRGPGGGLVDATYHFLSNPGADGDFFFALSRVNHINPTLPPEQASIHSRWKNSGAGRADVRLSGPSASPINLTVSECWDQNFISRYLLVSWDASLGYGDESQDCAFIGAQFASP